ncbi:hypothetical protein I5H01_gp042 [Mycobacterium phage MarkPhew]|uniref:Uncharacterized protein n=1 Tax=Mycobacterium phage MarkPhew TaxID=2725625 RepID=A0A6M3SWK8_9CAUD|nr:hypothetical protein I5H01_gp042 [Mycobacterium phage MarkPhew]QJD50365.1 hypothetical protein SEA_MARKPHEW_65 [Mycobacterium phage MarkPhew]
MPRRDCRRVSQFGDPRRWLIVKTGGRWTVRPPVGTFWGRSTSHDTGDQALADYLFQTQHHRSTA